MDYSVLLNSHLLVSAGLGAAIGLERELAGKDPSLRTFSLISMGSCLFCLISRYCMVIDPGADVARVAAQVVVGIGFIGAGAIFRSPKGRGISGLTTAALMWVTAGIGMAVGFDRFDLAFAGTVTSLVITFFLNLVHGLIRKLRPAKYETPTTIE